MELCSTRRFNEFTQDFAGTLTSVHALALLGQRTTTQATEARGKAQIENSQKRLSKMPNKCEKSSGMLKIIATACQCMFTYTYVHVCTSIVCVCVCVLPIAQRWPAKM